MNNMYFSGILIVLALAGVRAAPRIEDNEVFSRSSEDGHWRILSKILSDCGSDDSSRLLNCLGVKAVTVLDRASRMDDIALLPGISLVPNSDATDDLTRAGRALMTEAEIQNALPQDPSERSSRLMDMLYDATLRFLQSHTLQLKMPQDAPEAIQRALEEGRGKLKKKIFPILMLVGLKIFAVIPVILGIIGLVAAKALVVGKLALIIAGIIAIQKFIGSGGGSGFSGFNKGSVSDAWSSGGSGGWASPSSSQGGYYRRSIEDAAHQMAYSAQIPDNYQTTN
ncbi:uncharacterized protein LOC142318289 [Lycorma delicatula]|uniref:uncharacterized protein LOC142318289 n=1 Tax=Lycorma delicatula TaxID=130591 RepID=UPI003F514AF9